jgi:hypothetical protein
MKTFIIIGIISGLLGCRLAAQTADQDVATGLNYLASQDVVHANQQFTNALALSPTNASANALVAVTRLLLLPTVPAGSNLLNSLGFSKGGRDIFNWTSSLPASVSSGKQLPSENTAVLVAFYHTNIMAALAASRTNLAAITDPGFALSLTAGETSLQAATVDYGDILMLQALERVAEFVGYTASAQNGDVVLSQLQSLAKNDGLTVQKLLATYPSLLTLANTNYLASSKGALTNAIALYFAASDFIRNVRAPGAPALFTLSDADTNDEALFRTELTNVLASLNGPAQFNAPDPVTIDASKYFTGAKTLRSLLPQFNGDLYVPGTLPDYTFGGTLVDVPAYQVEEQLEHIFYSYAGIYVGQNGLYDDNSAINNGNGGYGSFAVFVSTNEQATVIGTDEGDGSDDNNAFGVIAQFNVDGNGGWSFQSNNVSGYGSFDKNGDFNGQLNYSNGLSVYLYASELATPGPLQNAAGYYSGTIQGGNATKLKAVLASDGEISFCPTSANGTPDNGSYAQLDANNRFITTSVSGTVIAGSLNPNTFVISGTFTNGSQSHGTWTMSRLAKVPADTAPVITKDLPSALTARLGTNLTLSVAASGTPPLSFQWYSNSVPLLWTTTNVLVIDHLSYSAAGAYSVTIENVAGEADSAVLNLVVVPELVPPTNQITLPTAGLQVSNAMYTVTGKAGDNVAVSNVMVQIDNGGWNPASTSNLWATWTAQVSLVPGSNTVQAYAVDTSANISKTNTVVFHYVASAPLTVQLAGRGTISPNDSNALLQIGASYTLKASAVAGSGFAFTNWTGGTGLPLVWLTNGPTVKFTMASNLVLQANFVDTNRPALTWTNVVNDAGNLLVTGIANETVAQVFARINGGLWSSGSVDTNSRTWSWGTSMTNLIAGTNHFQYYAEGFLGNFSLTNSPTLTYMVDALLTVQTNGLGVLTPNYNGASLQLGENYSITAMPAAGFIFTNWTGGTNFPLSVITNRPTVQFLMATNLILQANFVETNRPTLVIVSPTAGQHVNNALAYVIGTATDKWQVTGVWCQLNSNSWVMAGSTNEWANWTNVFQLAAGTNKIRAYAANLGGNFSTTNSVSVLSSNAFQLRFNLTHAPDPSGMVFNLQLSSGLNGNIEVSTNLADWTTLTHFVGTNASVSFRDPAATNGMRFYRAVVP